MSMSEHRSSFAGAEDQAHWYDSCTVSVYNCSHEFLKYLKPISLKKTFNIHRHSNIDVFDQINAECPYEDWEEVFLCDNEKNMNLWPNINHTSVCNGSQNKSEKEYSLNSKREFIFGKIYPLKANKYGIHYHVKQGLVILEFPKHEMFRSVKTYAANQYIVSCVSDALGKG